MQLGELISNLRRMPVVGDPEVIVVTDDGDAHEVYGVEFDGEKGEVLITVEPKEEN